MQGAAVSGQGVAAGREAVLEFLANRGAQRRQDVGGGGADVADGLADHRAHRRLIEGVEAAVGERGTGFRRTQRGQSLWCLRDYSHSLN